MRSSIVPTLVSPRAGAVPVAVSKPIGTAFAVLSADPRRHLGVHYRIHSAPAVPHAGKSTSPSTPLLRNSSKRSMLSLTIVVLLTSALSLIDDKDDAVVCLYTVLSYTTLRDTTPL